MQSGNKKTLSGNIVSNLKYNFKKFIEMYIGIGKNWWILMKLLQAFMIFPWNQLARNNVSVRLDFLFTEKCIVIIAFLTNW